MKNSIDAISSGLHCYKAICPSWHIINDVLGVQTFAKPDHVAWRTFRGAGGIKAAASVLEEQGYQPIKNYEFPSMNVNACHFEHPDDRPLVFVGELDETKLPEESQRIITERIKLIGSCVWDGVSTGSQLWGTPDYHDYKVLEKQSSYAAWVYVFGNQLNHSTVDVKNTIAWDYDADKSFGEALDICIDLLKTDGRVKFNTSNTSDTCNSDIIHISNDGLLHQASNKADLVNIMWNDKIERKIPGIFVELVQRLDDPITGLPKEGFEAENAILIFPSTDR